MVIDCTETGAPPPTGTLPTMIWRRKTPWRERRRRRGRHSKIDRSHQSAHLPKMLIGLMMSAKIVSTEKPPKIKITAYVTGISLS